jgi:hypothetical protein
LPTQKICNLVKAFAGAVASVDTGTKAVSPRDCHPEFIALASKAVVCEPDVISCAFRVGCEPTACAVMSKSTYSPAHNAPLLANVCCKVTVLKPELTMLMP